MTVCLSVSLFQSLSKPFSLCLCVCLHASFYLSFHLFLYVFLSIQIYLPVCLTLQFQRTHESRLCFRAAMLLNVCLTLTTIDDLCNMMTYVSTADHNIRLDVKSCIKNKRPFGVTAENLETSKLLAFSVGECPTEPSERLINIDIS